jgi:hypothetical protein
MAAPISTRSLIMDASTACHRIDAMHLARHSHDHAMVAQAQRR